jgi:hypothetical protein
VSAEGLTRRSKIGATLVALGVVFLIVPSLAPVQPVLYHDTHAGTTENRSALEAQGYTVVEYGELSPRAQELYRETLRNGGELRVPLGEGAAEFPYPTESSLSEFEDYSERTTAQSVVVVRPNDTALPPADEPVDSAEYRARDEGEETTPSEAEVEQLRDQIARYDVIRTHTGDPPLGGTPHLLRLAALLAGIVAVGTGGYLLSTHG